MGFFSQLGLLLWKNYTLRKRRRVCLGLEILFPLVLFIILVIVRTRPDLKVFHKECHFDGKAMPSAGNIPWLSGMFCTFNNTCHETVTQDEMARTTTSFNTSLLSRLAKDLSAIIGNENDVKLIKDLVEDFETIRTLITKLTSGSTTGGIRVGNTLIHPRNLTQQLQNQSVDVNNEAVNQLLNSTLNLNLSLTDLSLLNEILMDLDACPDRLSPNMPFSPDGIYNPNTSAIDLNNIVCAEGRLTEFLIFSDSAAADNVHQQLCNLTQDSLLKFFETLFRDVDLNEVLKEVEKFVMENTGNGINTNLAFLERIVEISAELTEQYQDVQNADIDSLVRPLRDMRNVMSQATNTSNPLGLFSNLVCGRNSFLLGEGGESLLQSTEVQRTPVKEDEKAPTEDDKDQAELNGEDDEIQKKEEDKENEKQSEEDEKEKENEDDIQDSFDKKYGRRLWAPVCKSFIRGLYSNDMTKYLWRQIKPLFRGYIYYYPDTPAVRTIIKEMNRTYEEMSSFSQLAIDLDTAALELEPVLVALQKFSNSCLCELLENATRNINVTELMNSYLSNVDIPGLGNIPGFNSLQQLFGINLEQLTSGSFEQLTNGNFSLCKAIRNLLNVDIPNLSASTRIDLTQSLGMVQQVAGLVADYSQCIRYDKFRGFNDSREFIERSQTMVSKSRLWASLEFTDLQMTASGKPTFVKYSIRMDADKVDSTKRVRDKYWRPGPRRHPGFSTKYTTYGFIYIQDMVDHAIIRLQTEQKEDMGIFMQMFPYPCYIEDKFIYAISRSLPLFLVLSWILTVALIVKNVVHEKERRLKEVLKVMGLGNGVHWVAWFINAFVVMFFTIVLLVITLKVGKVIEHSDPSVLLLFFTVFAISTIAECFLISTFFNRANLAACCAGFIYFLLYLPYTLAIQWEEFMNNGHKFTACLSTGVAFGFGCSYIARYEEQAVGAQWNNIGTTPVVDDNFNMALCIVMMLFDTALYSLATWYIEAVFPGQYGIPKKWYFPIQKSYWCGNSSQRRSRGIEYAVNQSTIELGGETKPTLEAEPKGRRLGVSIKHLRKVYDEGKKVAVDGLSLNFYESQITSFLGHNGAGKTTTMSILTGIFPPTDGTAYIYGKDIRSDIDEIRQSLGMCPQHNVLFDHLTVEEHMWFFARLRGLSSDKVKVEMEQMIKDVGLPHKRHELSASLSGGMKRKLSVAIAFVGGAKTVILDEPTAGVDPYARRSIWELLFKVKKDRTIILSTHHMDEADVLGDRIAIISQGKLCCCGSSLFLKSQFGNGYYLTLVKSNGVDDDSDSDDVEEKSDMTYGQLERPNTANSMRSATSSVRTVVEVEPKVGETDDEGYAESNTDDRSDSDPPSHPPTPPIDTAKMVPGFSIERVSAFIRKYVHSSRLVEDNTTELTFQLSDEGAHRGEFTKLFKELEKFHKDLGISSFGISDTSLEEVFLRVSEENSIDVDDELLRNKQEEITDKGRIAKSVTRLSFRKKKKKSFLKNLADRAKYGSQIKVDTDDLLGDTDSVASAPVSEAPDTTSFNHREIRKVTGKWLILRQFVAILIKRFHHVRRSKKGFVCEIILPAAFVLLAMIFAEIAPPVTDEPPLELHPWHYVPKMGEKHLYMFYSNDAPGLTETEKNIKMLLGKPGVGSRCMNPAVYQVPDYPCTADWQSKESLKWRGQSGPNHYPQCSCDTGVQVCPEGAGGPTPPNARLPSSDYLYNMTNRNISDWLVKTTHQYQRRRYGGFSFGDVEPESVEYINAIRNASRYLNFTGDLMWIQDLFVNDVNKVWYNNKGWAASVAYMNVMNNLILRSKIPKTEPPTDYGIVTVNHPIDLTTSQLNDKLLYSSAIDIVIAICVIFAMSFIPASFTMVLIEDRASNSKHLQFVSGVNPMIYWLSNNCWDLLNYFIPTILLLFIFLAFQREAYVGEMNGGCLVCLLLLYGWAMIPLMYPFTRLFSLPSTAMVCLQAINVFIGTTTTLATFIIEFLEDDDEELKNTNMILKKVFLVFPQYCLGRGLMDMSRNQLFYDAYKNLGFDGRGYVNPFEFNQVGKNLLAMFLIGLFFCIFNILIEYHFCIRRGITCFFHPKPNHASLTDEDVDVARERKRVMDGNAQDDVLRIEELTKVYRLNNKTGRNTAVDRLCFGVPKGQCFGLLGVNGAGKTTTFKMLTGDVSVTKGNAFLNGFSILTDMVQVHNSIGYCPQFDAFDVLLSGREILSFYARLRGIPEKDIKEVVEWGIRKLNLRQYADKISDSYSGGNKRKLSTAISLIGNPSMIFLDEPTTGMDPRARRFLWNCIHAIVKDGRSVILTSHSMEECEALCGRLGIMVNGRFMCMGSTQHLKNRFGEGYTVILRVSGEKPDMKSLNRFMKTSFPGSERKEMHHNMAQYQLKSNIKLSYLFRQIEGVREDLNIEDYSVSQTTLDQVFINFAKKQTDLLDDEPDDKFLNNDDKYPVEGVSGETDCDDVSTAGSTVELVPYRSRSVSDPRINLPLNDSYTSLSMKGIDNRYDDDGESQAGSTVDLIQPGRKKQRDDDFPSVNIF